LLFLQRYQLWRQKTSINTWLFSSDKGFETHRDKEAAVMKASALANQPHVSGNMRKKLAVSAIILYIFSSRYFLVKGTESC
jgi:hypothetical protein